MKIFTDFGWIMIDDKKFEEDIVICSDGRVIERPKHLSASKKRIYGHNPFTIEEVRDILSNFDKPEVFIIGTGQYGKLPIEDEVKKYLLDLNVRVIIEDTPTAIETFLSQISKNIKTIAILHITC
ncbi:MAG: MTH938/NDUFAF3 family protein [Candidatus Njordarchaeum guaymaensis]